MVLEQPLDFPRNSVGLVQATCRASAVRVPCVVLGRGGRGTWLGESICVGIVTSRPGALRLSSPLVTCWAFALPLSGKTGHGSSLLRLKNQVPASYLSGTKPREASVRIQ